MGHRVQMWRFRRIWTQRGSGAAALGEEPAELRAPGHSVEAGSSLRAGLVVVQLALLTRGVHTVGQQRTYSRAASAALVHGSCCWAATAGPLVRQHPAQVCRRGGAGRRTSPYGCVALWVRRTAILCQLGCKEQTDTGLLHHCMRANLLGTRHGDEFFTR